MGSLFEYVVSVPSGVILERYDQRRLKRQWGRFLGDRLKGR
jgi:hypothetical protein